MDQPLLFTFYGTPDRIPTPLEKQQDFADTQPAVCPTDSKTRILKTQKRRNYKQLIRFNFFN